MSQDNIFVVNWFFDNGFSLSAGGNKFEFSYYDNVCKLLHNNLQIKDIPASELEETLRKVRLTGATIPFIRDDYIAQLIQSMGLSTELKYDDKSSEYIDINLYPDSESLPYVSTVLSLYSSVYGEDSERFRELAFLNNFFLRSTESVERNRFVEMFSRHLEQSYDMSGVVVTALGSTSRGLATGASDIEIAIFDLSGKLGKPVLSEFSSFCSKNGYRNCVGDSSSYYEKLDSSSPNFFANAFMYACYGDFISLRRDILSECDEDQFNNGIHRFEIHNTIKLKHLPRFCALYKLGEGNRQNLPVNLIYPPTADFIDGLLPTLDEYKTIYQPG